MLGPLGRSIMVEDENGHYLEAYDARTFATLYRPEDLRDRLGASYAAEIVEQAHRQAGDGAATSVVLAQAMVEGAAAALRAGAHPMALASGIEVGVARTIEALAPLARDVETKEQISAFAAMVARNESVAEMIAEAMDKVGFEGAITVDEANTLGLELELTEACALTRATSRPTSPLTPTGWSASLTTPMSSWSSFNISANTDLTPVLEKVQESGKPLLIIAEDVDGEALTTLVVNKLKDIFKSAAVRAPDSQGCGQSCFCCSQVWCEAEQGEEQGAVIFGVADGGGDAVVAGLADEAH